MNRKRYLLLLGLSEARAVYGLSLYARIRRDVDPAAKAAWIDERGIGVFLASALTAQQIWALALPQRLSTDELAAFHDMLLLELGQDHMGVVGSPAWNWLSEPIPG